MQRVTNMIERPRAGVSARLRVVAGENAGIEVVLPPVGVVLGADPSCDVVLKDPAVSRRHATVVPRDEGFEITDLDSKNGTWLDGAAVGRAVAPAGAMLRLGTTLLHLLPREESIELEPSTRESFGAMVGKSLAMRRVYAVLERAAQSSAPILLLGESGTGKELAARAVHEHSPRKGGPFVVFDCGAASDSLIESELFGHKRGAFTGAQSDRPGAFALADKGTLFLDEIGDLPLGLQPKLLRLVERGEVTPLGARKSESYDVRIVSATHHDLFAEVGSGAFRGDLFYRLGVVEVHLPPLRKRIEDVPFLVSEFLRTAGAPTEGIAGEGKPGALDRLLAYGWPGNVRELKNVVTRAIALSPSGTRFSAMPVLLRSSGQSAPEAQVTADVPYHQAKDAFVARFEQEYLKDLLRRSGENLSQAARIAGLERKYLYKVLERAGLLPTRIKPDSE
jgi:DNA-binding NtrC family response regulator